MSRTRILDASRRLVVALLAVALSSQLVDGQVVHCAQMQMSAMTAMQGSTTDCGHSLPARTKSVSSTSDQKSQTQLPTSPNCALVGSCIGGPAVPSASRLELVTLSVSPIIAHNTASLSDRSVRPEAPPPRF